MKPHLLDPRSKLIAAMTATGVLIILDCWLVLLVALGLLVEAALALRLGWAWLALLKGLGVAAASFFAIVWLSFDLPTALASGLRLLAIGTVSFLFFQTTPPEDLSNALVKMGAPYAFAFVMSVSMQFVQVLARKTANVRDAQRARGIHLEGGLSTARNLPALVGPLLVQAFKLSDELAEAMEARGFGAPVRRFRRAPRFGVLDWIVVGVGLAGFIAFIWRKTLSSFLF